MAVRTCSLRIDMRQHEIDNRGTPMFPCGGYTVSVGDHITDSIPWHWHDEVEVLMIESGILKLDIPNQTIVLREGEAAFVNSGVLHTAVNIDMGTCEIKSLVFNPQLIFGFLESAIEQKYVRPLINSQGLSIISFQNNLQWHKDAIKCIEAAFVRYQEEAFGYEILVREYLSRLWFLIISNYKNELELNSNYKNTEAIRVKEMLCYIHTHYEEPVSLKDIADSASISSRECLRCFNKIVSTTPMKYLLNYRISVAAGMFIDSDLNITEISKLAGFESPSYFSMMFKKQIGVTPRQYRNLHKKEGMFPVISR